MALFFLRIAIILAVSIFLMWWFMPNKGDVALFEAVLKEYEKAPKITKERLFWEKMIPILDGADIMVVDKDLKSVLPLLNLNDGGK